MSALAIALLPAVGAEAQHSGHIALATDRSDNVQKNWFRRGEEGWYWYEDPESEHAAEEAPTETERSLSPLPDALYPPLDEEIDPLPELERVKKAVETAQARVVLQPTEQHVRQWLAVMHEMNARSALFADQLRRTVWNTPAYDYSLVRPNNPAALGAWTAAYNNDRTEALQEISRTYGLYFFVAGNCEYCHEFAPYLKRFAQAYGFDVLAITLDGGAPAEFADATWSPAFAEQLGVRTTPALFLANPRAGDVRAVAYGMISLSELEHRIYRLFRMQPGQIAFQLGAAPRKTP